MFISVFNHNSNYAVGLTFPILPTCTQTTILQMEIAPASNNNVGQNSRKDSIKRTIDYTMVPKRKDSVTPLLLNEFDAEDVNKARDKRGSDTSGDRIRRLSRRLSLKPPSNVYRFVLYTS